MKLKLKPLASDIVISIYAIVTLYLRFHFESESSVGPLTSLVIGALSLFIPYALIKIKVLNPGWFGLFNSKRYEHEI